MSREQKIREFMKTEGLSTLNEIDSDSSKDQLWKNCDICSNVSTDYTGTIIYECEGFNLKTHTVQNGYQICDDCLYFINYGEEL